MTNIEPPSSVQGRSISFGWLVCGGGLLGAVLVPTAVFGAVEVYDRLYGACSQGAEGSLACVLRQVMITAMSVPIGAVIGFVMAYRIGSRRHAAS
jgi:hypothetical protein